MSLADIIGYLGTVTGTSFMLPQLYRTYTTKSVEDLSWLMLFILLLNSGLWFTYGKLVFAMPIMVANATVLVITALLIVLKIRYRNNP